MSAPSHRWLPPVIALGGLWCVINFYVVMFYGTMVPCRHFGLDAPEAACRAGAYWAYLLEACLLAVAGLICFAIGRVVISRQRRRRSAHHPGPPE